MKNLLLPLYLAALSLLLSGCFDNNQQTAAEPGSPATASSAATETEAAGEHRSLAGAHIAAFQKDGRLYFYNVENNEHTTFADESGAIFSFAFDSDGRTLYYTVVRDGTLWLRQAVFAEDGIQQKDLHNLKLDSGNSHNVLTHQNGKLMLMSGLSEEMQIYTTYNIYLPAENRLISTNDSDQAKQLLGSTDETVTEESEPFSVRNGQLFYQHNGEEVALSDRLDLKETDENHAAELEFRRPMLSPDGSKIAFEVVNAYGDLAHGPLCIADADGKNQQLLSRDGISQDHKPRWVGNRLVFLNSPLADGNSQLKITDPVTNRAADFLGETDNFDVKPPAKH